MKTVIVVQARLKSTRLPGKILLPLPSGRVVLEECIYRCRQARHVHQVVVASPDSEDCDILEPFTAGATWIRGPEDDVLARYAIASRAVGAKIVVRVTSDCPLITGDVIDRVIQRRNVHALSYACNNLPASWPLGYTVECFTDAALQWHAENSWDASSREHVTTALRKSVTGAQHVNEPCPQGDMSHIRLTLDTISDFVEITRAFNAAMGANDLLGVVGSLQ